MDGFSTITGDTAIRSFPFANGVMTDLGTLGGPNSQSFAGLTNATQVPGEIVGLAVNTSAGEVHAFLAIPTSFGGGASAPAGGGGVRATLPENARKQLQQWQRLGRFSYEPPDPCLKNSKLGLGCKAN